MSRKEYIVAGGSQHNEAKVFDASSFACIGAIQTPKPVYSVDFNNLATAWAVGGADGMVRVLNMPGRR